MFKARSIQSSLSMKDKILSIDYILVISIFILGLVSILAMYSTDGGELKYHTKSHTFFVFLFFLVCY
jgi:rod shape determining protein RodA